MSEIYFILWWTAGSIGNILIYAFINWQINSSFNIDREDIIVGIVTGFTGIIGLSLGILFFLIMLCCKRLSIKL